MMKRNLIGALLGAAFTASAPLALATPVQRVQVTQKGDFVLFGNTIAQDCSATATQAGVTPLVGTVGTCPAQSSNYGPDVFWEADFPAAGQATASTAISAANARSTAVLVLPAGAQVTHAYLYWSGRPSEGTSVYDPQVIVDRPGAGGFSANITATTGHTATGNNVAGKQPLGYESLADVTALVQQNGAGAYRLSGIDSLDVTNITNQPNAGVGWWMVVFYADAAAPLRQLTLFDGLDWVNNMTPAGVSVGLSGFLVPSSGYTAHLGVVALQGDATLVGDQMLWNGTVLSDAQNPANDFFNGSRSFLGSPVSNAGDLPQVSGAPGSMSEIDLDVIDITGLVTPGQTSATLTAKTTSDSFFLSGFITAITTLAPDFTTSTKSVTDLTSGTSQAHPGDILQYTIVATNTGTDTAINTVLSDPLPAGVTFVPGSLQITTGANAGAKTDALADDQGDYDSATNTVHFRLGTGAGGSAGGTIPVGGSSTVTFRVQINAAASGIIANQAIITAAGQLGAPASAFPTDGNGPTAGAPPTPITIQTCPIAVCACLADSDCGGPQSGTVCDNGGGGSFTCIPGCRGTGGNTCMTGMVCSSTTTAIGSCSVPGSCNVDSDCTGGKWCHMTSHTCTAKIANGSSMPSDPPHTSPTLNGICSAAAATLVCVSGVCDPQDNLCGYADGDGPCTTATGATVCRSGACSANGGVCVPAGGCAVDADCASNQWCNTPTFTCAPKLLNGQDMPTAAGHSPTLNGVCTAAAAIAVCLSAVCDVADNRCGYADGDGPCTVASGPTVCRSGICGTSGVCVASGGCSADSDCAGNEWCNISIQTCTAKLNNGAPIPTDPGHTSPSLNGTCTQAAAVVVCVSGVCDPKDNACGYANGDGPCTSADGGAVCRSTICATTGPNQGLCVACVMDAQCPVGTPICTPNNVCGNCLQDSDCGDAVSGQVCDASTGLCAAGCRGTGGNGCPIDRICTSKDSSIGVCLECQVDADCGGPTSGIVCDPSSSTCKAGCRGTGGNGCPSGQICSSPDISIGTCGTGCQSDSDCGDAASGKICDAAAHACVSGCRGTGGNACPVNMLCTSTDGSAGQCVGCRSDADCGDTQSARVCDDATSQCRDGCRGQDGNGCHEGDTCSSQDATIGTCASVSSDDITASGNGLICAAQPAREEGGAPWLLAGISAALLALRRRRR